jgi:TetR/AcrR family transcriptional regulator
MKPSDASLTVRPVRNAEQTRARILDVAAEEFAENGYGGARIDRIVELCGMSKNLLYHYFDGKEALFVAVIEMTYRRMRERQSEWTFRELPPAEGIRALVSYTFDHFVEEPTVMRLINTENLHHAIHLERTVGVRQLYNPLVAAIEDLLARGRESGEFRADVDPVDLYITISGLSYFYLSSRYTLSYLFQQDLMAPERLEQRRRHAIDVVLGYLRP